MKIPELNRIITLEIQKGKKISVLADDLRREFSEAFVGFNPLKGENQKSELNRWLKWICVTANCEYIYKYEDDIYIFYPKNHEKNS